MDSESQLERRGSGQKSFRNKIWQAPGHHSLNAGEQFLKSRCIECSDTFSNPTIRTTMPDPMGLYHIQELVDSILKAKLVGIFGDYDADGITSTVMWKKFLDSAGIESRVYVPNRQDGYGASTVGINSLLQQGVDLILFLDCGSASKELVESIPVTVCILDHHQVQDIPNVAAVVNPHAACHSHESIYKTLCTSGLSFLVLARMARMLNKIDTCLSLLDLSAIGTLGDMMELNSFNRACVKRGLELINSGSNLGLTVLANELRIKRPITASNLAYYIIPCLNASGRISSADLSIRLLTSQDEAECVMLAKTLKALNERRKAIEEDMINEAVLGVDQSQKVIVLKSSDWHPGVVGIVASRIKEMYSKTSFVLYKSDKVWKGSARSHMCNVGLLIQGSVSEGLALQGGGHFAAGGITICESMIQEWEMWVQRNCDVDQNIIETIEADCLLEEARFGQIAQLRNLGPFGNGNLPPRVILNDVWLRDVFIEKNYVKCVLTSGISLIGFRFSKEFLALLNSARGRYVDFLLTVDDAGTAKIDDVRLAG